MLFQPSAGLRILKATRKRIVSSLVSRLTIYSLAFVRLQQLAGGKPGEGTIRVGSRVPWGAEVEFSYTTDHDGHGLVSVNRLVHKGGCSEMLKRSEADAV